MTADQQTRARTQTLLEQAIDCIDAALNDVNAGRAELMGVGMSAYTLGTITATLAGAAGDLEKCRRMLPGYKGRP